MNCDAQLAIGEFSVENFRWNVLGELSAVVVRTPDPMQEYKEYK